jgi:glycosyltransferase involved in cell wall biosynthesis
VRILFLTDFYPPVLGGLELQVQATARGLATRGHQVSVATLTLGSPGVSDDEGVTVHRIRGWNRLLAPVYEDRQRPFHATLPDPGVVAALRRIVRAERPQAVSAQSWIVYSFLPLKRASGARLSMRLHDYGLVCPKKTFVHRGRACDGPAYGKCLRCADEQYGAAGSLALTTSLTAMARPLAHAVDVFIANSSAVADASRSAAGRRPSPVAIVPPSVEDSAFDPHPGPRPAFLPSHGHFLLFVGALGGHKGLDVLLEAYSRLTSRIPLILLGMPRRDTPDRLPPGVTIVPEMAHVDVLAAWPHCTLAVVPSLWPEPFGVTAVEAMAAGRAVVASDTGGLRDIVDHEKTGLLVRPGDAAALAGAIARLLSDPTERRRMGAAGRERSRRFAASRLLPEMERLVTQA